MSHEIFKHDALPRPVSDYTFFDSYRVPLMAAAPNLDGRAEAAEWRCAAGFDGLSYTGNLEDRRARTYIGATETHLYVAVLSEMPPAGELVSAITTHSDRIIWDDVLEVWVDPSPGSDSGIAYQMLVSSKGIGAYNPHPRGQVKPEDVYGWKGNYRIANGFHDGWWHCEIEIPLSAIAPGRKITEGRWGINVCRDFKAPWAFSSMGNRGYNPADEIVFTFAAADAAAIQVRHDTDPITRNIDATMSLYNPGPRPVELAGQLFMLRDKMPEFSRTAEFVIAPGETKELKLQLEDLVTSRFELFALVRGKGGEFHYTRYYRWGPPREPRWESQKKQVKPVDFRIAFYPYSGVLRVQADVTGLPKDAALDKMFFAVRPKGSDKPLKSFHLESWEFRDGKCDRMMVLPGPLAGQYEITARTTGTGTPEAPLVKTFERTVFEWERKGLGTSRKVYAPFTPIEVSGRTLRTVMKEYDLNDLGLLDAVRTDDQQRLGLRDVQAGAMTYRAVINGQPAAPAAGTCEVITAEQDEAVIKADFALGAMPCSATCKLDYDGMLRVDLTLMPIEGRLDSLDLEIPLRESVATMMHAMSDGLRMPVLTCKVPAGEGEVWNASKLQQANWPPNFCTYIFLGDARRGLCWFAENDRGWSWDAAKPNLWLVRKGGQLLLRVHLVNQPLELDAPRTLTFGVQAAPAKPWLEGWRHRWFSERYSIIGTDIHWFALGCCASVYPAGKDLQLWETLRRSTRERLSDAEIEATVQRAVKHFEPYGPKLVDYVTSLARMNLRRRYGTTSVFYYNRASYPQAEEFQTFMDEWCQSDFNDFRNTRHRYEVKIVPSESYIDYALHWYGRSFDVAGNTGIYVDNIFFDCGFNQAMTGAYTKEDGTVMPSTGIWALRELNKRQFVFMNERGMKPITMVHMTGAQILPLNSWYTVNYDWEWHFSEGDVQNRFTREYIQMCSTGEHIGAWPVVLHEQGRCVADPWTLRTYLAVSLVHELIVDPYVWDVEPIAEGDTPENRMHATFRQPILDLVQQEGVEVFRYWDERPLPVSSGSADLPTIVFSRPGCESLAVICSYSDRDEDVTLTIDPAALGLPARYSVIDIESGESLAVTANQVRFALKKHDLKEFRITPR